MTLLITGKKFVRDLETMGSLGVRMPLEGGFEGRYRRRLRAAGYETLHMTVRGLGDLSAYLMGVHGVRPPHLGKKSTSQGAAVGKVYYIPPILRYRLEQLSDQSRGLVVWLIEGNILSQQEVEFLIKLPQQDDRLKVVLEMGGDRSFQWMSLQDALISI